MSKDTTEVDNVPVEVVCVCKHVWRRVDDRGDDDEQHYTLPHRGGSPDGSMEYKPVQTGLISQDDFGQLLKE